MQEATLAIAIICSILVLTLRPCYALAVYIISMLWYPSYLVVSIGTIDISVGRIVAAVLLIRSLSDNNIRTKLLWSRLDTWVAVSMAIYVGVFLVTRPASATLENRSGFLMDTWLAYFVGRFMITNTKDLTSFIKCISIALVPLAILGVIEATTGWQFFIPLKRFCPWYGSSGKIFEPRWGLERATGPFTHSILFGCAFVMFVPLIHYLRYQRNHWRVLAYVFSGIAIIGALSSMSSGPWVMVIATLFCLTMEKFKVWVKPLLISFPLLCVFIGIASNRPFYHVLVSYANPIGGSGWHRARLVDAAIDHFSEWWLLGYKGEDPGWGHYMGMSLTDVTNEFILAGVFYGIFGVIALCWVLATAFRNIIAVYRKTSDPMLRSLCWSFGCILFSIIVVWMSVSFFGQIISMFYCLLGIIGSLENFAPDSTVLVVQTRLQHEHTRAAPYGSSKDYEQNHRIKIE